MTERALTPGESSAARTMCGGSIDFDLAPASAGAPSPTPRLSGKTMTAGARVLAVGEPAAETT